MRIEIRGVIVPNDEKWIYEWFGFEATAPGDVQKVIDEALKAVDKDKPPEDLEVVINSYGGEVYSGSEIYTALKGYPGKVVVKIVGLAASAASLIAMAGDPVMISPTAQIMIHNVQSIATGDHRTHEHEAGVLRSHDAGIANAYRLKSGMGEAELLELMGKETWLNAQQALEHKLVDEIMFDEQMQLAASASPGGRLVCFRERLLTRCGTSGFKRNSVTRTSDRQAVSERRTRGRWMERRSRRAE